MIREPFTMRPGLKLDTLAILTGMVLVCLASLAGCASGPVKAASDAVNVKNYSAKGNGTADDSAAVARACASAVARHKALYVPKGTYRIEGRLKVPKGLRIVGDGAGSWLKGGVVAGQGSTFSHLTLGRSGRSCYIGTSGVTFSHVRFVGGGGSYAGTWPYLDSHVITVGVDRSVSKLRFLSCRIQRNSGTENYEKSNHYDNVFIMSDVSGGGRVDGVLFQGCRFAGSPRFNVEVWDDGGASVRKQGTRHVNFKGCTFAASEAATLDYSGARDSSGTSLTGYSLVSGCKFRGNGTGDSVRWPNDITVEKGASHLTVRKCTFYRGLDSAFGADGGHNSFIANRIDATDAVVRTGITHKWIPYVAVGGDYNVVRDNVVHSTGPQPEAITVYGNHNTVTGNKVRGGTIVVNGTDNETSGNTIR